jgi:hypothetical protein
MSIRVQHAGSYPGLSWQTTARHFAAVCGEGDLSNQSSKHLYDLVCKADPATPGMVHCPVGRSLSRELPTQASDSEARLCFNRFKAI